MSETNVALHKAVTASGNQPLMPPSNAVDGSNATMWNAGAPAAQQITIDLDATYTITRIELVVEQEPAGPTKHVVLGGTDISDLKVLDSIASDTANGQTIHRIGPWPGVRWLQVLTEKSPSWVAWREIRAFSL